MIDRWSPNQDARTLPVSMLVLHYTGMRSAADALARLCDPAAKVSAHYCVAEDGTVFRLVPEERRAWHAGAAWWRGVRNVNSASIGVELVNPGHEWGYLPFPDPQVDAVVALVDAAVRHWRIDRAMVVGHSDVAPRRKDDPGELFPWERLARAGLALGPPAALMPDPGWTDAGFGMALQRFGYELWDPAKTATAFQRHFRPARVDGAVDAETRATLLTLLAAERARLALAG